MSLLTKLSAVFNYYHTKFNELDSSKQKISNLKQSLEGTDSWEYPSVPAVNAGLTSAKARANHTGQQAMDTISGLAAAIIDAKKRQNHTGTQTAATISDFENVVNSLIYALSGAPNGLAELGPNGKLLSSQLNALAITEVESFTNENDMLAWAAAGSGDVAIRTDLSKCFIHNGGTAGTLADWSRLVTPTDAVLSVNGQTGIVVLGKADIGLGNVQNLAPADMPISTAAQNALDAIQAELDAYQLEVGTNFPDYLADAQNDINF